MTPEQKRQRRIEAHNAAIPKIMASFDFNRVHRHMLHTGWTWYTDKNPPSVDALRKAAHRLLQDMVGKKSGTVFRCGGFRAESLGKHGLMLQFVVEEESAGAE